MEIKKYLGGLLALSMTLTLAACVADSESAPESKISETQANTTTEIISNVESEPQDESIDDSSVPGIKITVDTISYVDEMLTFEYEGNEYTLPLSGEKFVNDYYWRGKKLMSEQIINNKLGESVTAEMNVNEDMTEIYRCDVTNQNGMVFYSGMLDSEPEDVKRKQENPDTEEYLYTLTNVEGTKYELSNVKRTLSADLNDLNVYEKVKYPDSVFDVTFSGYLFDDGQFIISNLCLLTEVNKEEGIKGYDAMTTIDYPDFFGTVQSYDEETADILLTDGITSINVPTYYCEEELSTGQEVMITLDCGIELFGSGESDTFDYAVIHTDPKLYNYDNHVFSSLAYAKESMYTIGVYDYVFIDEVQP